MQQRIWGEVVDFISAISETHLRTNIELKWTKIYPHLQKG